MLGPFYFDLTIKSQLRLLHRGISKLGYRVIDRIKEYYSTIQKMQSSILLPLRAKKKFNLLFNGCLNGC